MPTNINGNTGIDKVQDGTVVSADIATLDASKLTGSIAAARIANNTIDSAHIASGAVDDAHISGIASTKLTGTIADARFPSTLPAASAANLTAIPAANITGTLPAISGANLTGISSVGGATGADFNDNVKARFGTGNDLEIYSDGNTSYIKEVNASHDFHIQGKEIVLKASDGVNAAIFRENGGAELMHDGTEKFKTTATGVDVTGAIAGATNLGKVLQVKSMHTDTATGSASGDWHATAVTLAITPSATSSKILVSFDGQVYIQNTSGDGGIALKISRTIGGSTSTPDALHSRSNVNYSAHYTQQTYGQFGIRMPLSGLDAPNTTSEITYKLYFFPYNVNGAGINNLGGRSTLTLMEIAG